MRPNNFTNSGPAKTSFARDSGEVFNFAPTAESDEVAESSTWSLPRSDNLDTLSEFPRPMNLLYDASNKGLQEILVLVLVALIVETNRGGAGTNAVHWITGAIDVIKI